MVNIRETSFDILPAIPSSSGARHKRKEGDDDKSKMGMLYSIGRTFARGEKINVMKGNYTKLGERSIECLSNTPNINSILRFWSSRILDKVHRPTQLRWFQIYFLHSSRAFPFQKTCHHLYSLSKGRVEFHQHFRDHSRIIRRRQTYRDGGRINTILL